MDDGPCEIKGCSKTIHAKGLCRVHYGRKWRTGSTTPPKKRGRLDMEHSQIKRKILSAKTDLEKERKLYEISTGRPRIERGIRIRYLEAEITLMESGDFKVRTIPKKDSV